MLQAKGRKISLTHFPNFLVSEICFFLTLQSVEGSHFMALFSLTQTCKLRIGAFDYLVSYWLILVEIFHMLEKGS